MYTGRVQLEHEIDKIISFTVAPNTMKYLGTDLRKHAQDLYAGNYKMLMNGIKDWRKWRDVLCSWMGRLNTPEV